MCFVVVVASSLPISTASCALHFGATVIVAFFLDLPPFFHPKKPPYIALLYRPIGMWGVGCNERTAIVVACVCVRSFFFLFFAW